jgi:hypothetical protein
MRTFSFVAALMFAAPAFADTAGDAEKLVSLMEKLGTTVEGAKGDCDKMAKAVSKFADANAKTIQDLAAKLDKISAEGKEAMKKKYADRVGAAQKKIGEGAQKCMGNKSAEEAFKKLLAK